ncbi:MAG TPA: biopolymer transporter ExbD, partial [Rhodanobacteraceae bacterium]|nr:biopolymer transporter ExbD [Rhodanobacteraceae bacterium]
MAMSTNDDGVVMAEINVTPMADVMLVLLIVFMITTPLMQHKVKIELPTAVLNHKADDARKSMDLAIQPDGSVYLDDQLVSEQDLKARLAVAAQESPQPEVQIRADKSIEYRQIWDVMSTAKSVGIVHL